jgi:hypothetical protein
MEGPDGCPDTTHLRRRSLPRDLLFVLEDGFP